MLACYGFGKCKKPLRAKVKNSMNMEFKASPFSWHLP